MLFFFVSISQELEIVKTHVAHLEEKQAKARAEHERVSFYLLGLRIIVIRFLTRIFFT